jgi:hypothetical protein
MNSTRCPFPDCPRRKGKRAAFCSYHWLIVVNDVTYAHRYLPSDWREKPVHRVNPVPEKSEPMMPVVYNGHEHMMVPARVWSAKIPAPDNPQSAIRIPQ